MNTKVTGSYCIIHSLHVVNISLLSLLLSMKPNMALFSLPLDLVLFFFLLIYLSKTPGGFNVKDFQRQQEEL